MGHRQLFLCEAVRGEVMVSDWSPVLISGGTPKQCWLHYMMRNFLP